MAGFVFRMIICGAVVTALSFGLVVFLQWLETAVSREVGAIIMAISVIVFLFGVLPFVWWALYIWLDKVMNGISSRMSRRDR